MSSLGPNLKYDNKRLQVDSLLSSFISFQIMRSGALLLELEKQTWEHVCSFLI